MVKTLESRAKEEEDKKAKELVVNAIQRCAADHVAETTISVVQLPNDKTTASGVSSIISSTPVSVSRVLYYDPLYQ